MQTAAHSLIFDTSERPDSPIKVLGAPIYDSEPTIEAPRGADNMVANVDI